MIQIDEKKRYNLKFDKKRANEIKAPSYSFGVNEINKLRINFEAKKFKVNFDYTYSFITMYDIISSILNQYYEDLDDSKINKEEYNKLILYLIYYTTILNDDFPKDTSFFLFYCLDLNVKMNMK